MSASDPAIIGIRSCGCITLACAWPTGIPKPKSVQREHDKAITEIVRSGGNVVHTTVGEAKAMPHFLESECPHNPKGWEAACTPRELHGSSCCGAEVRLGGGDGTTRYWVCSACEKVCDRMPVSRSQGTPRELTPEAEAKLRRAYLAGFLASAEGFNGEYPFDSDPEQVAADEHIETELRKWLSVEGGENQPHLDTSDEAVAVLRELVEAMAANVERCSAGHNDGWAAQWDAYHEAKDFLNALGTERGVES